MPALFILFIVFGLIAVGWFLVAPLIGKSAVDYSKDRVTLGNRIGAGVVFGIAALFLLLSSVKFVGTQDIGVITSFGHPSGAMSNGLHWKAPWEQVTVLDGKIQTDTYASNADGSTQQNAQGGCISVRIARQATACVNLSIRWQNDKNGIDYLFRNFHDNENIRDKVIHRDLQTAVNVAFAKYDPLGLNANGDSTQPTNTQLADTVLSEMKDQVGQYLDVQSIYIPIFNFDQNTQARLNLLQQQVAQTRVAQQAELTAQAQAAANKALAASVSNDPGVLVSKCLDILSEAVQKGQALPAGFSCFGNTNTSIAVK